MVLTSIVPWIGPQPVEFGAEFIPVPREGLPFSLVVLILVRMPSQAGDILRSLWDSVGVFSAHLGGK